MTYFFISRNSALIVDRCFGISLFKPTQSCVHDRALVIGSSPISQKNCASRGLEESHNWLQNTGIYKCTTYIKKYPLSVCMCLDLMILVITWIINPYYPTFKGSQP